jgi:16S rRNA (uracil1498-N3)-methyltransferase
MAPEGGRVRIEGAAAVQIRRVLRLGPGDQVILFGADEWEYTVQLESVQPDAALGRITDRAAPQAEPRCELTLVIAVLKGEKLEWVLQKGTELGVARFLLMQTERTVAAPDERRMDGRRERYARIVLEATEQCGRVRPPCVEAPVPFSQALANAGSGAAFLLHTGAGERLSDLLRGFDGRVSGICGNAAPGSHARVDGLPTAAQARHSGQMRELPPIALYVGPEGGFTEAEVALTAERPVILASLGPRVLRAETAALAAVSLAMDALDR